MCPTENPDYKLFRSHRNNTEQHHINHQVGVRKPALMVNAESTNTANLCQVPNSDDEGHCTIRESSPSSFSRKRRRRGSQDRGADDRQQHSPRTIFHKAIDALSMTWDHPILDLLLSNDLGKDAPKNLLHKSGYLLWNGESSTRAKGKEAFAEEATDPGFFFPEHVPTACARVEALRCHGFRTESLRLAVAVVRTMREQQKAGVERWNRLKVSDNRKRRHSTSAAAFACFEGWVGHSLDPINSLVDLLMAECLPVENDSIGRVISDSADDTDNSKVNNVMALKHRHTPVPDSNSRESYLTLAMEAALMGLGQQRVMPPGLYAQEKACTQEEKLLSRLRKVELDSRLLATLCDQTVFQLDESGPLSGLGEERPHPETVPMHTFARYLFTALLPHDEALAFRVGLRAMRLPVQETLLPSPSTLYADAGNQQHRGPVSRWPRWFTLGHLEEQQCALASTILVAAKGQYQLH